jgi:zinc D-Ala-D-Ala carboxypeptidase
MRLSKNFTLAEMTKSQMAIRNGIDNTPSQAEIENMKKLANMVLQPVRDRFGPVSISSGFRSVSVNSLVGGSPNSDHTRGMAADIEIPGVSNLEVAEWIAENLKFTQLILEFYTDDIPDSGWVHVAYNENKIVNEILRATRGVNGRTIYLKGLR